MNTSKKNRNIPKGATCLIGSVVIASSKQEVWEVVKNIGAIADFHPLIRKSYATNEKTGVGAKRHCDLKPMGAMDEEITEWKEEDGFTAKVVSGKMLPPYKLMIGNLLLERLEDGTRATFTFTYQLKFGTIGRIMNVLLVKPQFRSAPLKYVEGLKSYMENN